MGGARAPENPSLVTCNPYRATRRDLKGTSTGPDMVAFAQKTPFCRLSLLGLRPNMAAARDIVTIRSILATARADGTRGGTSASAVPGRPARRPVSRFRYTPLPPRQALRCRADRDRRPGTAEALGDQQPAAAPQFHRPMPRGKQSPQQLHLGNAVVAEAFGLQFLFEQLDSGVEFRLPGLRTPQAQASGPLFG